MLDYRLRVFQAVAEKLNFTRAAESLHISQPAVTQHIKLLEESYGTPLFHRAAGGIALTPAGEMLSAAAARTAELERQVAAQIRSGQALPAGPLRLGASSTVAQYFLPTALGNFQVAHPQVQVALRIGNTRDVADAVRADRLDLGLVEGPGERRNLQAEPFFVDEVVCVTAPDHPLARRARTKVADLAAVDFIQREPGSGTRDVVERALKKAGLAPRARRTVLETDSSETIKGLVATGIGAAFLSRLAVALELAVGRLVVVPVTGLRIRREFFFLRPHGPRPTGAIGVFMDAVKASTAAFPVAPDRVANSWKGRDSGDGGGKRAL